MNVGSFVVVQGEGDLLISSKLCYVVELDDSSAFSSIFQSLKERVQSPFLLEEILSCSLLLTHHVHRFDKSKSLAYSAWC